MIRNPAQPKLARPLRGKAVLVLSLGLPAISALIPCADAFAQGAPPAPPAPVPAAPTATATVAPGPPAPLPPGATYYPGAPPAATIAPTQPVYPQPAPQPAPQPYAQPYPQAYPPGAAPPYGVYAPAPTVMPDVLEDEGQPVPAGYRRERRPRGGLVIAGIGVFAPLYAFSLTAAMGSDDSRDRWLALPVFGPVVDMLQRKSCESTAYGSDCNDNGARTVLAMDFVGQATGVLLFSLGYGIPREVFVRGERAPDRSGRSLPVIVVPGMIGGASGAPGLSAAGMF